MGSTLIPNICARSLLPLQAGCTFAGTGDLHLVNDQRGDGFPRQVGLECDKGAYEQQEVELLFTDGFEE